MLLLHTVMQTDRFTAFAFYDMFPVSSTYISL